MTLTLHYTIIPCVYWHSKGLDLLTEAAGNLALLNSQLAIIAVHCNVIAGSLTHALLTASERQRI